MWCLYYKKKLLKKKKIRPTKIFGIQIFRIFRFSRKITGFPANLGLVDDFSWFHENPDFEYFGGSKIFSEKNFCSTNFYYKKFFSEKIFDPPKYSKTRFSSKIWKYQNSNWWSKREQNPWFYLIFEHENAVSRQVFVPHGKKIHFSH